VYIDQLAVNNNLNTGSVDNDISYVMMGQNLDAGCSNSISQNEAPAGITSRIAKEWKVTKTNFNQLFNCDIQIDTCTTAGFTVGPVDVNSFRLLVDDDGDFTNATIFSPAGSLIFQYNDGYVTISGISFNEIPNNSTRYITLAYNVLDIGLSASTTSICKGESTNLSLVISNATTPVDVTYTAGSSNPVTLANVTDGYTFSVSPQVTTVYTITGNTNFLKCCSGSSSNTITITVKPLPVVVANASSLVLCQGDSTKLFGTGANSYIWNQSALDQTYVSPNQTTMYTVIGANSDGCSNDSSVQVSVNPVPDVVVSSNFSEVCFGDPVTLTAAGATSYTWSDGVTNGQSFIPSVTTTYTVVGSNQFNCIDSATINIVVHPLPPVLANASDLSVCFGEAVTLYGTGATTFQWNNGVTNNLSFIPENSTTYTVVGTDQFLCSSSDNIQIIVFPAIPFSLGQDPIICPQNPIQLSIDQTFSSYLWSTGSTSPQITVNYPGEFYAVVIDENGCAYTDTIEVKMSVDCFPALYVPNTFTPNEDENNNTFKIFGEYVDFFEMKIYNKWGELIFESNDLNSGWDGTYGGVLCPDGIYSYEIKYSFTTDDASLFRQIGHVNLIK
jgi:gliding motility-associated-like protein